MVYSIKEQYDKASKEYELALEIYSNDTFTHQKNEVYYELANGLGVTYARLKQFKKAQELFKTAKKYALKSLDEYADQFAEYELGPSIKYWPAIIKGLDNKIEELNAVPLDTNQKGAEKVI
jgi:tetratricopeptide (TPR) repeat protein